jgi:hypothetical protein
MSPAAVRMATPRTRDQIAKLSPKPQVVAAARERGITEVVHFTTMNNMIGILHTALLCWSLVRESPDVEKVFGQNCPNRYRDAEWIDYVNLSITRPNYWMFGSSSRKWHPDAVWVVLAFDVEILGHPGVVLTTTNNAYETCLRSEGRAGFDQMFADPVLGYNGRSYGRAGFPPNHTTDHCAEVLYPASVSIEYLRRIYAKQDEDTEQIAGILGGLGKTIEVMVEPRMFRT